MIERRLVGRRFVDFYPESAHSFYPGELERRLFNRRAGAPSGLDALLPGRRRRPPILWSGIVKCADCGRELRRIRNLSSDGRKYFIAECVFGALEAPGLRLPKRARANRMDFAGRNRIGAPDFTLFREFPFLRAPSSFILSPCLFARIRIRLASSVSRSPPVKSPTCARLSAR